MFPYSINTDPFIITNVFSKLSNKYVSHESSVFNIEFTQAAHKISVTYSKFAKFLEDK